jgi:hypothetical protein
LKSWVEGQLNIEALAERQLFFVGGAPRSGTTWLQLLLDHHPEVSCRGEGLFWKELAQPIDRLMAQRRTAIETKNKMVFGETGGFPPPDQHDAELLLGTAILLALARQSARSPCRAIGEKTPENVLLFPRLKRLFPGAKFIGLARDPRDVLSSAWHFFGKKNNAGNEPAAIEAFVRAAIPLLHESAQKLIELRKNMPASCLIVTYEQMHNDTAAIAMRLFRFLGVLDEPAVVANCVERTRFEALAGGRPAGVAQEGAFFRKGIVGDWRETLSPELNEMILDRLGWMFSYFGWSS